jgi:hypothetical protein
MRGDEVRVVNAFRDCLVREGWTICSDRSFADLLAERAGERLYVEAKGRTADIGLDLDTLYGQLLRRMPEQEIGTARFAVVVPTEGLAAAIRVPGRVRRLLGIDVYSVDDVGRVTPAT